MHVNWRASSIHAAVVGVFNSGLQLVAAFGVALTDAQNAAITAVVNSMLVMLSVIFISTTSDPPAGGKA